MGLKENKNILCDNILGYPSLVGIVKPDSEENAQYNLVRE